MNSLVEPLRARYSSLAHERDAAAAQKAFRDLLQYLRREPTRMHRVGPISLWLCGGYPFDRVERMLELLVVDGIMREATQDELKASGYKQGYYVTTEGLTTLPPEDRSYGVI